MCKYIFKIKAILVDTKWLMENHNRNDKMIKELAELIENKTKEKNKRGHA